MHCLSCGFTAEVVKEWNYSNSYYHVKLFECTTCHFSFKGYYHNGAFSHTIPKSIGTPERVLKLLRRKDKERKLASIEEIAEELSISVEDTIDAILKLRKDGLVEKIEETRKKNPIDDECV